MSFIHYIATHLLRALSLWMLFIAASPCARAQCPTQVIDSSIHTLQLYPQDAPLDLPIIKLHGDERLQLSFDDFSHEYHRYIYHVEHLDAGGNPSAEIFESDFLDGFNDMPIEDYEKSFNTTLLYTHYSLLLPNEDTRFKLSGNYSLTILNDDGDEPIPVAKTYFMVVEPGVNISQKVSSNTDIDFNASHQQLDIEVNYSTLNVMNPAGELQVKVMQNGRYDNAVHNLRPNQLTGKSMRFTHNKQLIFPAGNEYHKFELLDVHQPMLGIDRIEWHDPHYHATLYAHAPARNYIFDRDQDGAYVIRNSEHDDVHITSNYVFVHFTFFSAQLPGADVYIDGDLTRNTYTDENRMQYDALNKCYRGVLLQLQVCLRASRRASGLYHPHRWKFL